jgi:single-stranded-DNA-specific exonuclease
MALAARMQKRIWDITAPDGGATKLAAKLNVSPLLAQVLLNRGITTQAEGQSFLWPKLSELIEPVLLPGIAEAVARIKKALQENEKISIYGDYDVDGITAVAILWHLLDSFRADVEYYIPHRIDEGYGLNEEAITQISQNGTKLLITVDCGICAHQQAELAAKLGLDLIITDHHQPDGQMPDAEAIVHPALDPSYPNQNSAGATVALKLAWALVNEFRTGGKTSEEMRQFLLSATTLAAIGTIADVVDLNGENRILTHFGLKALPESQLPGILALIEAADLADSDLDSYDIAFRLAPMLNAAGRMGHARLAVELLTTDNTLRAMQIAQYLKQQNTQRQKCQRDIFARAHEMINNLNLHHPDRKTIVLADDNWHTGVIGIVASRIIDKYFKPTIMINSANATAQGSARSIDGFDIHAAITACSEHLESFGGHPMAAGLKIKKEKIDDFTVAFEQYAQQNLSSEHLLLKLNIDRLCSISELSFHVVRQLKLLEPFGRANPQPTFATKGVRLIEPPRRVGRQNDHLQIAITDNTASVRCIAFGMGKLEKKLLEADFFSVAYRSDINTFNGNSSVQLIIEDIRFE